MTEMFSFLSQAHFFFLSEELHTVVFWNVRKVFSFRWQRLIVEMKTIFEKGRNLRINKVFVFIASDI